MKVKPDGTFVIVGGKVDRSGVLGVGVAIPGGGPEGAMRSLVQPLIAINRLLDPDAVLIGGRRRWTRCRCRRARKLGPRS